MTIAGDLLRELRDSEGLKRPMFLSRHNLFQWSENKLRFFEEGRTKLRDEDLAHMVESGVVKKDSEIYQKFKEAIIEDWKSKSVEIETGETKTEESKMEVVTPTPKQKSSNEKFMKFADFMVKAWKISGEDARYLILGCIGLLILSFFISVQGGAVGVVAVAMSTVASTLIAICMTMIILETVDRR